MSTRLFLAFVGKVWLAIAHMLSNAVKVPFLLSEASTLVGTECWSRVLYKTSVHRDMRGTWSL